MTITMIGSTFFGSNGGGNGRRGAHMADSRTKASNGMPPTRGEHTRQAEKANVLTGQETVRMKVSELLKRVDALVKLGEFPCAADVLAEAKTLEPYNIYIYALEERLARLQEERVRNLQLERAQAANIVDEPQTQAPPEPCVEQITTDLNVESPVPAILKRVDELVTKKQWDGALQEVKQAREIDPSNRKLRQLEVRILDLKEESQRMKKIEDAKQRAQNVIAHTRGMQPPQPSTLAQSSPDSRQPGTAGEQSTIDVDEAMRQISTFLAQQQFDLARAELQRLIQASPGNPLVRSWEAMVQVIADQEQRAREIEQMVVEAEQLVRKAETTVGTSRQESSLRPGSATRSTPVTAELRRRYLTAYRQCLEIAWSDGVVGTQEDTLLKTMREQFGISQADHESIERDVQWSLYLSAIVDGWLQCLPLALDSEKIDRLQEQFQIPAERHIELARTVRQELISLIHTYKDVLRQKTPGPKPIPGSIPVKRIIHAA